MKNRYLSFLASSLAKLVYPPRCLFCRKALMANEQGVCAECLAGELPFVPFGMLFNVGGTVSASPFYYEGKVRDILKRFKFQGAYRLAPQMAGFMAGILEFLPSADVITWVPVSKKRMKTRGYDQAELLARHLADLAGMPVERLLVKTIDTLPQSATSSTQQRLSNVEGAFEAVTGVARGRHVLLVDDILTMGYTLTECAKALREGGAASVACATFATVRRVTRPSA